MSKKKTIFALILIFPVVWTLILSAVGYVYCKDTYVFKGLGVFKVRNDGTWPVIVKAPHINHYGVIQNYQPAWRYLRFNGENWGETGSLISPKNFNYEDLRKMVKKHNKGHVLEKELSKIEYFEKAAFIEKINTSIPWEIYAAIGIWLAFFVVFKGKALTAFFIWSWYTVWRYASLYGFYAYWNTDFHFLDIITDLLTKPLGHYSYSIQLILIEVSLLFIVPFIQLLKHISHLTIDGVSNYFGPVENKLSFKKTNLKKRRVNHDNKIKFTLPN